MALEGKVRDLALPEVFRLIQISAKTGVLRVRAGSRKGSVHFRSGQIHYAFSSPSGAPFAERLIRAGKLRPSQLKAAQAELGAAQAVSPDPGFAEAGLSPDEGLLPALLPALLLRRELVSEAELVSYLRDQIEDSVFNLFSWPDAEFEFILGEEPDGEGLLLTLDAEAVIMEGVRRVDEWPPVIARLGSLEKVPHLEPSVREVSLKPQEWALICLMDGRRDGNTIVAQTAADRFHAAKALANLVAAGLVTMRDPTLELLGKKIAVALQGPIDIYNLTLLASLCDSEVTSHRRTEPAGEEEIEVQFTAGVREDDRGGELLVYFPESRTPPDVIRRMALETSGFIVLVNINSRDSVAASRRDVALMQSIKERPWVVAAYASMVDEAVYEEEIRQILSLPEGVPVVYCNIRDPEDSAGVLDAVLSRLP